LLVELIENKILLIRGQKVMLSMDLAKLYGVEHRVLMQAVKRNITRFPKDFMFQLSPREFANLKSQHILIPVISKRKKWQSNDPNAQARPGKAYFPRF